MDKMLEQAIRVRGLEVQHADQGDQLLTKGLDTPAQVDRLYQLLHRYSFRLFLRDLLENQPNVSFESLTRYCSPSTARRYLNPLEKYQIVRRSGPDEYQFLLEVVPNFGETLEWYLAEIFKRELTIPASFRVVLKNGLVGGDYDVLALAANHLIYVEVKSSPPKAVDNQQVKNFLSRLRDLLPDLAFFFEDTHLRMKDKIVHLFEEELARRYGWLASEKFPVVRLKDELFHINHRIYIINSKRGILNNILSCFRDHLEYELKTDGMP